MAYRMTPARKAALRKAQAASARARRGTGKAARSTGRALKRGSARRKATRKANREKAYGKTWKSANAVQKANRVVVGAGLAYNTAVLGTVGYAVAKPAVMNSSRGRRYQARKDFKQQYGKAAYKTAKRKYKSNVKARRNPGPTTMSWGPRSSGMAALPRGRGSNQKRRMR
jgi:hypothetical protein